jgi:hypothetical protein
MMMMMMMMMMIRRRRKYIIHIYMDRSAMGPTQPPIQWAPGALFSGLKWPGSETDHSPPFSDDVKNARSYTFTPPYAFMGWCLDRKWIRLHAVVQGMSL